MYYLWQILSLTISTISRWNALIYSWVLSKHQSSRTSREKWSASFQMRLFLALYDHFGGFQGLFFGYVELLWLRRWYGWFGRTMVSSCQNSSKILLSSSQQFFERRRSGHYATKPFSIFFWVASIKNNILKNFVFQIVLNHSRDEKFISILWFDLHCTKILFWSFFDISGTLLAILHTLKSCLVALNGLKKAKNWLKFMFHFLHFSPFSSIFGPIWLNILTWIVPIFSFCHFLASLGHS